MDAKEFRFNKLLEGEDTYSIPVYQRNYAWSEGQWEQLYNDVCKIDILDESDSKYFLGPIILLKKGPNSHGGELYDVVDGQQRLTTITLLLLAMHKYTKNAGNDYMSKNTLKYLQIEGEEINDNKIKLKPNNEDQEVFNALFDLEGKLKGKITSNIEGSYNYFYNKFESDPSGIKEFFNKVKKLHIVLITLTPNDNVHLTFESINSKGEPLKSGDLIRNYILMDIELPHEQEKCYNEYWKKIENFVGNGMEDFMMRYLSYKFSVSVVKGNIYSDFKNYTKSYAKNGDKKNLLLDIKKYAEFYANIMGFKSHENAHIQKGLDSIRGLDTKVCTPYFFDLLTKFEDGSITLSECIKAMKIIESYILRRLFVFQTTQGFNKLFVSIANAIEKSGEGYIEGLEKVLQKKDFALKFPTDEEFREALTKKEAYFLKGTIKYFLHTYESYFNDSFNGSELHIDHIMPQKWSKDWDPVEWEKAQEVVHTIGNLNLVLNSKNKSAGNKGKVYKASIDTGNRLKLNESVKGNDEWSRKSIENRSAKMADEALKIWQYLEHVDSNKSPASADTFKYYLSEVTKDLVTDSKPALLCIDDATSEHNSWRQLYQYFVEWVYDQSPVDFKEEVKRMYYSRKMIKPYKVRDVEVDINLSAYDIIKNMQRFHEAVAPSVKIELEI